MRALTILALTLRALTAQGSEPSHNGTAPGESSRIKARHMRQRIAPPLLPRGRRLVQLADGPGHTVFAPDHAWGLPHVVHHLADAFTAYRAAYPDAAPVLVQDLSRRRGGRLLPHQSHRTGRDVDIRYVTKRPRRAFVNASPSTLDVERTWFLISTLVASGDVEYVFVNRRLQRPLYRHAESLGLPRAELDRLFQYPRRRAKLGIIRHEPGHMGHFHVRFFRRSTSAPVPTASAGPTFPCVRTPTGCDPVR